ncbi:hypothetical protein GCM10027276_41080 [Comamonas piscis]
MMFKGLRGATLVLGALMAGVSLTACVQMPTEKQSVVSLKPQISFRLAHESLANAAVVLDGLQVGTAGQFQAGQSALQVEPGMHQLLVQGNGSIFINEKFYVGDGVTKTFDLR